MRGIHRWPVNSPQKASNAENASIWWRHHDMDLAVWQRPLNSITHLLNTRKVHTLRPRQNGRHFPDDIFKRIFLNENVRIPISISLEFVPKGQINNSPALVQIMVWRRPGDKPLYCLVYWRIYASPGLNALIDFIIRRIYSVLVITDFFLICKIRQADNCACKSFNYPCVQVTEGILVVSIKGRGIYSVNDYMTEKIYW